MKEPHTIHTKTPWYETPGMFGVAIVLVIVLTALAVHVWRPLA